MNRFVRYFIEDVLKEIRYEKIHPHIAHELEDHIESLKACYEEEGMSEDLAYEKAVRQMGNADDIGKQLHKIHRPKLEWSVLLSVMVLIIIGLVAFYSYGGYEVELNGGHGLLKKQIMYVGMGTLICLGIYFLDYRKLEKWSIVGYALGLFVLVYGKYYNEPGLGTVSWVIRIGPVIIMSKFLAVPLLVVSYAGIVHRWGKNNIQHYWILGLAALFPVLFISEQGVSYSILLGISLMMVLTFHLVYSPHIKEKKKLLKIMYGAIAGISCLGIIYIMYYKGDYLTERMQAFLHPEWDPKGNGYLPSVMKAIRENATLIGDGGFQAVDIRYFPEPTNDMIFTFILGSMGWLIGCLVIGIIGCIIVRMFCASLKVTESYGRLISMSITSFFALQLVYNIAMNLGYVPQIEMTLPFVSYSGTSMIMNMMLLGLFLSIYRKKDLVLCQSKIG